MFLKLAHTRLDIFKSTRELALSCYRLTKKFPDIERFGMIQQIRRAALSIHLNLAGGGSNIEVDTALDIALALDYATLEEMESTGQLIIKVYSMLSNMIKV